VTKLRDSPALHRRTLDALAALLGALEVESTGPDTFRARSEHGRFDRVFGGQLIAQAIVAAAATVDDKPPHSVHAYFAQTGVVDQPLDIEVGRVRDGRSMATREVRINQQDRTLLTALVSFHDNPDGPSSFAPLSNEMPAPEQLPLLQDWIAKAPPELSAGARTWSETPPPVEFRIGEPTFFLGQTPVPGPRSHWMRIPSDVGDDPLLHSALLAYASDYFLLDMAFRCHPEPVSVTSHAAFSLDHSLWIHRPVRFDRWHLYTQEATVTSGHRGLVRGSIYEADGRLVATTSQEVLVRNISRSNGTTA
jgi:acyl-CoA thioesterase II